MARAGLPGTDRPANSSPTYRKAQKQAPRTVMVTEPEPPSIQRHSATLRRDRTHAVAVGDKRGRIDDADPPASDEQQEHKHDANRRTSRTTRNRRTLQHGARYSADTEAGPGRRWARALVLAKRRPPGVPLRASGGGARLCQREQRGGASSGALPSSGVPVSAATGGGRPRLGMGLACRGIRPASLRARRSSISMWALRLRNSSADHRVRASWTVGSMRSSTCLRSRLTYRASRR